MSTYLPPPTKKLKVDRLVSEIVLRLSPRICKYLNVDELRNYWIVPELEFLRSNEQETISKLCDQGRSSYELAKRVVSFLRQREASEREETCRRFIACVVTAEEHYGHLELAKIFRSKLEELEEKEWVLIQEIRNSAITPLPSPYTTPVHSPAPERPMPLICLEGRLTDEDFVKMDRKLWLSFSRGSYDELEVLITDMEHQFGGDVDCRVVALWFQALIMMHCHVDYPNAIQILDSALKLATIVGTETYCQAGSCSGKLRCT